MGTAWSVFGRVYSDVGSPHCPKCKSMDIEYVSPEDKRCLSCGFVFAKDEAIVGVDIDA